MIVTPAPVCSTLGGSTGRSGSERGLLLCEEVHSSVPRSRTHSDVVVPAADLRSDWHTTAGPSR